MERASPRILTINGGSSSIKFALFEAGDSLRRVFEGGTKLEEERNAANEGVISTAGSRVAVRVIRSDEERVIAEPVCRVLGLGRTEET